MKTLFLFSTFALAGVLCLSTPVLSQAQSSSITLPTGTITVGTGNPIFIGNPSVKGSFRATDGTSGTYLETVGPGLGNAYTDTVVYTLANGSATSTDMRTQTLNADGSLTVVYSHTAFGATAAFTSTTVFPNVTTIITKPNGTSTTRTGASQYGTGTFTAADGTTGTLTTFLFNTGTESTTTSTDYTSAAGLTREVRNEHHDLKRIIQNVLSVDPAGKLTTTTLNRTPERRAD